MIIAYFFLENFYIDKTNEFVNLSKSYNQECLIENIKDEVACDLYRYSLYNYKDIREEYLKYKAGNVDLFEKIYIVVVSFGALSWFISLYMISLVLEVLYKNIAVYLRAYLSKKRFKY